MNKSDRILEIENMLKEKGEILTVDLADIFQVSEMTIRRDIDYLCKHSNAIRTRGGVYMPFHNSENNEPSYLSRINEANFSKNKIAYMASKLIQAEDNIFIDSGTTTEGILQNIASSGRHHNIVTNDIMVAYDSVKYDEVSIVLIGGDFRENTLSTAGVTAESQIRKYQFDIAFIGCNGIDSNGNAYVGASSEVGVKQSVIESSVRNYILADSSKLNKGGFIRFINLSKVTGVITDDEVDNQILEHFYNLGINVIVAKE